MFVDFTGSKVKFGTFSVQGRVSPGRGTTELKSETGGSQRDLALKLTEHIVKSHLFNPYRDRKPQPRPLAGTLNPSNLWVLELQNH
jgi:hypothetical protein